MFHRHQSHLLTFEARPSDEEIASTHSVGGVSLLRERELRLPRTQ
jgi:hypothetical protein